MYDKLSQSDKLGKGHQGGILDIKFDELVSLVFRDVGPILLEIYQVYFSHEVKGNQGGMPEDTFWKLNEKSLFEFLRDYDICPSLLSKSAAYQVFYHAKNAKQQIYHSTALDILTIASQKQRPGAEQQQKRRFNIANVPENSGNFSKKIGRYFTFVQFLEMLVKCAKMTFSGYSTGSESQIYQGYKVS